MFPWVILQGFPDQTWSHETPNPVFASSIISSRIVDYGLIMAGPPCSLMTGASSSVHMRRAWRLWGDVSRYKVRLSNRVWLNFVPSLWFGVYLTCLEMFGFVKMFMNQFLMDQGKTTFEILWILLKLIEMVWNGLYMFVIVCIIMYYICFIFWNYIELLQPLDGK